MIDIDVKKLYYFGKEEDWLLFLLAVTAVKKARFNITQNELKVISEEAEQIKSKLKILIPDLDPDSDDIRLSRVWDVRRYKLRNAFEKQN